MANVAEVREFTSTFAEMKWIGLFNIKHTQAMEAKRSIIKSTGEVSHPEDKIKYIFLLLFLFIVAVGMEAFAVDYVVTANTLNVRSAPNVHSKVIGKLAKGDQIVNASSEPGDWICFMLDGKEMGYASTQYLKPINKPQKQNTLLSQDRMRYVMAINEAMNRLRWCVCIGLAAYFIFFVLGDRLGIPVFLAFLAMLVLPKTKNMKYAAKPMHTHQRRRFIASLIAITYRILSWLNRVFCFCGLFIGFRYWVLA